MAKSKTGTAQEGAAENEDIQADADAAAQTEQASDAGELITEGDAPQPEVDAQADPVPELPAQAELIEPAPLPDAPAPTGRAAVICDFGAFKIGAVVEGSAGAIKAYAAQGTVDAHPDAVDARLAAGALVVSLGA